MLSSKPVATAVLAVYNGGSTIKKCLDSLLVQTVKVEIIVVDDGSTDQTVEVVKRYQNIILLSQNHQGPATARNLASSHAHADILFFVDADMTFDKNYVKDLIAPIVKKQVIGTYTIEERVSNWDNIWARCWNIEEGWENQKRFPKNPPKYGTDFRAILKSEFDKVGGFDNIGYTDTWSLFAKLGAKPLATSAICYHQNPPTLSLVFIQAKWGAKRPYKLGILGTLYALLRTTLPISLLLGLARSITRRTPSYLVFKLVYDFGRFVGILEMVILGKLSK